ncbi:hypothetical protein [Kamptonema sp. UHCC 0994]|uniref:hypothetical protein n=1 Tax=Kamptonema sp. UHCC 0994 TaxID=3031329 RepID=UPI0023B91ABF|nr:hypothetical protein [Kamptonema sp. UHCC 0994]MDF0555678.1 hypothetical protein [Kamptonema sp. UHCC 0994]
MVSMKTGIEQNIIASALWSTSGVYFGQLIHRLPRLKPRLWLYAPQWGGRYSTPSRQQMLDTVSEILELTVTVLQEKLR